MLDTAQREPVTIARGGRTAAFIISPQVMEELIDARSRRGKAVAEFEDWSRRASKSALPAAAGLTEADIVGLVHKSR